MDKYQLPSETYESPKSADELLVRYAKGERNFAGAMLKGAWLRGVDLRGVNLRDADLSEVDFGPLDRACSDGSPAGANLQGADLTGAVLDRAYLSYTDLRGANLSDTRFANTVLAGLDLSSTNVMGAFAYRDCSVGIDTLERTAANLANAPESKVLELETFFRTLFISDTIVKIFRKWIDQY